jgi:hypothetical protein
VIASVTSAAGNLAPDKRTMFSEACPDAGWELATNYLTLVS